MIYMTNNSFGVKQQSFNIFVYELIIPQLEDNSAQLDRFRLIIKPRQYYDNFYWNYKMYFLKSSL